MTLHALHTADRQRPASTPHGVATAHFGELREPLLAFISASEIIVGCVAWVTDKRILDALAARPVALVVQKETWWKKTDVRGAALAARYARLQGGVSCAWLPDPLAEKTFRGKRVPNDATLAPIACVGHGASSGFSPLMHHKFVVRCRLVDGALEALAVWTGSFNFSANANDSFENAVEIHDPTLAAAYLAEFALVASVSEPMHWRSRAPKPSGLGSVFVPPPTKPTTRVVKRGTTRPAAKPATKKTATKKTAAKTSAVRKTATVTPLRPTGTRTATTAGSKAARSTTAKKATARRGAPVAARRRTAS